MYFRVKRTGAYPIFDTAGVNPREETSIFLGF
jgi:hypothetical protein